MLDKCRPLLPKYPEPDPQVPLAQKYYMTSLSFDNLLTHAGFNRAQVSYASQQIFFEP